MPTSSSASSSSASSDSSDGEADQEAKEAPEAVEAQEAVAAEAPKPDWLTEEEPDTRSMVFLVTFAAVLEEVALQSSTPLKTLEGLTREAIRDAILDAVANPADQPGGRGGRPRVRQIEVVTMVVFLEMPMHFHVAMKLSCDVRFLPFKLALRNRSGLASHWSTTHTQLWSAIRYGVFTTDHKPVVDAEPLVWTLAGGTLKQVRDGEQPWLDFVSEAGTVFNLHTASQEPWNAKALKRRREKAEVMEAGAAALGSKKPKIAAFNRLDFLALVLEQDLLTPTAVLAHVKQSGSAACRLFVTRNQRKLAEFISDAVEWRDAERNLALEKETDWDLVLRLSKQSCACNGECQWRDAAGNFCDRNRATIDHQRLAADLARVIQMGPSKTARVPMIVGPTNAGKSLMLDPCNNVFGRDKIHQCPALGATMPLASLVNGTKRFLYWDEYSPTEYASRPQRRPTIPAVTFKKLLGGQLMEIQVSQSFCNGNPFFQWQRGAALTAPLADLWKEYPGVSPEDIRHMKSRVELYEALVPIEGPLREVPWCAESWCRWLVEGSAAFAARALPAQMPPIDDEDL